MICRSNDILGASTSNGTCTMEITTARCYVQNEYRYTQRSPIHQSPRRYMLQRNAVRSTLRDVININLRSQYLRIMHLTTGYSLRNRKKSKEKLARKSLRNGHAEACRAEAEHHNHGDHVVGLSVHTETWPRHPSSRLSGSSAAIGTSTRGNNDGDESTLKARMRQHNAARDTDLHIGA